MMRRAPRGVLPTSTMLRVTLPAALLIALLFGPSLCAAAAAPVGARLLGVPTLGPAGLAAPWTRADEAPPTTTAAVSPAPNAKGWHKTKPVIVTFTATDDASAIAYTKYSTDAGVTYTEGSTCSVTAEGGITVLYWSADTAGYHESAKDLLVQIDTVRPKPVALKQASAGQNKYAVLRFAVNDASCETCTARLVIRNNKGKTVKKAVLAGTKTNAQVRYHCLCPFKKGTYKWYVYATDLAGNKQVKASWKLLIVK